MIALYSLLAQTTQPATPPEDPYAFFRTIFPLILVIGVFWWLMSRGRNKERQRYEQMLNSIKRNDRVQTIGGILGTVVDVREDEIVLKVDETANVKMRFNRAAIKGVIEEGGSTEQK